MKFTPKEFLVQIRSVLVFAAASLLSLSISSPTILAAPLGSSASSVYVIQNDPTTGAGSVLQFPAKSRGLVAPTRLLSAPTDLSLDAVATDAAGNIYVSATVTASPARYELLEYSVDATGTATLTRTLTNLPAIATAIAVDSAGEVYALNGNSISVFAATADGDAAPTRVIAGDNTQLNDATAIAVDGAQNVYVANTEGRNVLVFAANATGNVAPARTIAGSATGITQPWGVAVDASGNLFVTSSTTAQPTMNAQILTFAPGADGDAAPIQTQHLDVYNVASGIAVDAAGNRYTTLANVSTLQLSVGIYPAGGSNDNATAQTIAPTAWTAAKEGQIAIH